MKNATLPRFIGRAMPPLLGKAVRPKQLQYYAFTLAIAALVHAVPAVAEPLYSVRDLGALGGSYGIPVSINNIGQVVGDAYIGNDQALRATVFGNAGAPNIDLGTLGGINSYATGINIRGQVVGYAERTTSWWRATLFGAPGGQNIDLGTLGGVESFAAGINDNGQIVGYAELPSGTLHAALFSTSGGQNIDLDPQSPSSSNARAINNNGQAVGSSNGGRATLFSTTGGSSVDLGTLGGYSSSAMAINDSGQIVGRANVTGDAFEHATMFSASGGQNIDLGTLNGTSSWATAINNTGQVVGYDVGGNDAFIWNDGFMESLDSLIDPALHWDLIYALDINDAGQVAAYGFDSRTGEIHGLLLSVNDSYSAPEPSTSLLTIIAILAIALARKQRRT